MPRKADARNLRQDLMRGEHVLGKRKANAEPAGGGGGGWAALNRQMAENRAKRAGNSSIPAGLTTGEIPNYGAAERTITGTSIFDPVLCELAYRWFCPPGGLVLDPFAGGSVRGVVASRLGRRYLGIDLRPEQLSANQAQAAAICGPPMPEWIEGDSRELGKLAVGEAADFLFTCPPYGDLERYSDDPRDLSTMAWPAFLAALRAIIAASVARLKPDRFACFVVGDFRDREGYYRGLPWRTIEAFQDAGARLYNEAVLVTAIGSLPIRVTAQFESSRKLGKTHQNVLVFCKGNPRKATAAVGPVEFGEIPVPDAPTSDSWGEKL
jgi:hypothetical protein